MNKEERILIYDKATKLWGLVAQFDQCVEEMAELTVAINKYKRKVLYDEYKSNEKIVDNLVEEIADVTICIEQMTEMFKNKDMENIIETKMLKFKKQIEDKENGK